MRSLSQLRACTKDLWANLSAERLLSFFKRIPLETDFAVDSYQAVDSKVFVERIDYSALNINPI